LVTFVLYTNRVDRLTLGIFKCVHGPQIHSLKLYIQYSLTAHYVTTQLNIIDVQSKITHTHTKKLTKLLITKNKTKTPSGHTCTTVRITLTW